MTTLLDPFIPSGDLAGSWEKASRSFLSISTQNKERIPIIVVGAGLAGASAAATLAEQGYPVKLITYHDSPRRAHSVAAQGGINAARLTENSGFNDIEQLFKDTIRGGDFRSREADCLRLAEISSAVIDQCVAQGVPFARDYNGELAKRRFGGALVSRTFYARGQTGQQLLYGAYQALMNQVSLKKIELFTRRDVLDFINVSGTVKGVIARNLLNGELETFKAQAVILATGGYSNVYFLSTNSVKSNATAIWRAHRQGAFFANPCFTQIHPTCIPLRDDSQSKLTLMSESLRNDGRIWLPKIKMDRRNPIDIPENERDYFLERMYPSYGNLVPRDVASRRAQQLCDDGFGVASNGCSVYLDLRDAVLMQGPDEIKSKYGNLLEMYERIVGDDPLKSPMCIAPAPHYTMGGLWVDYNLMSNLHGLFVLGEANCTVHGANRLGANALLQCLADGYFIAPSSINGWLAAQDLSINPRVINEACQDALDRVAIRINALIEAKGTIPVDVFHRRLGEIMRSKCGISRNEDELKLGLDEVGTLKYQFHNQVLIPSDISCPNPELEKALRLADFFELSELMLLDALERNESCGAHFRTEHQTSEGESLRNDKEYSHIAAWEYIEGRKPVKHCEDLSFRLIEARNRSYK